MSTPNAQIPLEARQTVLDQVVAGASFTAYEITLEVRRRLGPTVDVPHGVVNPIVQAMFANGEMAGYDRAPDTSVKAATPPFRYAPRASQPATVAPTAVAPTPPAVPTYIGVNRANLPISLRYWNPIAAVIRAYAMEARTFHDAAGAGNTPFKVWLPTTNAPRFRVRSYGTVPTEQEVEERYGLSNSSKTHLPSKAAYSYADEFRITTFAAGKAKTFRAALDMNLGGTVTKDGEVSTKQPDGVEIEVPVKASDLPLNKFGREAAPIFAYFRVPPTIEGGVLGVYRRPTIWIEGNDWKITSHGGAFAVIEDAAYAINSLFLPRNASVNIELRFSPGELQISETGESLDYSAPTRQALATAFNRMESEAIPQISQRIGAEPNLWDAKVLLAHLATIIGTTLQGATQKLDWRGIQLENDRFDSVDADQTTIYLTARPAIGTRLKTRKVAFLLAQPDTVILFNDLNNRTGSPSRLREYFAAHPDVQRVYTLTFVSDAARARFIADNHFESVPTQLLSSLPKPISLPSQTPRTSNRIPFDPTRHVVRPPRNPLAAAFPNLNDKGYADLERWIRDSRLDGKQWPDLKRLYKKAEGRIWPLQNRSRWDKTEADLPQGTPLPDEREAFLLGVLIGHLDSSGAKRGEARQFPNGGPTANTVAYLTRRASRLLRFLRDEPTLSDERRALLAPLVAGSMVRAYCADLGQTLAVRLGLQNDALVGRPDLVQRIWNEPQLAVPVLKWAFEWLRTNGEAIEGTPQHIRAFINAHEAENALALLPGVLDSAARWPRDYGFTELSRDLTSSAAFATLQGQVLRLLARYPVLKAPDQWIWMALGAPEANEPEIVRFATPLVEARARNNEWERLGQLAPAIRTVFLEAFVASHPKGLRANEWREVAYRGLLEPFYPALARMPMSAQVAQMLWDASAFRDEWFRLGGESQWVVAFAASIRDHAQQEDFHFASQLPPLGRSLFFQKLLTIQGDAIWSRLGDLPPDTLALFAPDFANVPLPDSFWKFAAGLGAEAASQWLDSVGRERATNAFSTLPTSVVRSLLDSGASGVEPLIAEWLSANSTALVSDEALLMLCATNFSEDIRTPALDYLRQLPLNLRLALRLVESGLPEAQSIARPYFEDEGDEWAQRALALADSPVAATRLYALDLLARFPARWTPELLQSLAQHDDTRVQAFVAGQLAHAPEVAASEAVAVFDSAIINSRGRARRAKTGVQRRLQTRELEATELPQLDALLDAVHNGAPRDRAWALQQLVRLRLSGADIPDLQLRGAVTRAAS